MVNIKLIKKSNRIVDFVVLHYIFLGLVCGTVEFLDDFRWSFAVGLGQEVVQKHCDGCQDSEKQHYFEPALKASVDDLGRNHCGWRAETFDEADCDQPHLGGVEFIEIDCVEIEGVADCQLNQEDEDENGNTWAQVDWLSVLVPDEGQNRRTYHDDEETDSSRQPPGMFVDSEPPEYGRDNLSWLYGCPVEENVEIEVAEHKCRGEILQIEDAVDCNENEGHNSEGFVSEEIDNCEFFHWGAVTSSRGKLFFVIVLQLFDLFYREVHLFYSVEIGNVQQILVGLLRGVFGYHADGGIFEQSQEDHSDEKQGDGEEENQHHFEIGDQVVKQNVEEGSYVEHGGDKNFEFLPFGLFDHLGYKYVGEVEWQNNSGCQHQHTHHAKPVEVAEGEDQGSYEGGG